jgi:hypothetical protein
LQRAQGCPEPMARGSGAPHDRTCAPARRRCSRPIRFGGPGMQPIPSIIPGGTQRAFPSHTNGRRSTRDRQPAASLPLGSIALRTILNRLSRSIQLAAKRAG